jgi:hypothetical protein
MPTKPATLDLFMKPAYRLRSLHRARPCVYFDQAQSFEARRSGSLNESEAIEARGVRAQPSSAILGDGDPFTSATVPRSELTPVYLSQEPYRV